MTHLSDTPAARRLVQAFAFETIGLGVTALTLSAMTGARAETSSALAAGTMVLALIWNLGFNHLFETWEARQPQRGRSFARRALHAVLFEGSLSLVTLPMLALALDITLWQALVYDIGLNLVFMAYTFAFTLIFDLVIGLPQAAR